MDYFKGIVVLCSFLVAAQAWSCPLNIPSRKNFNASSLLGTWYQIRGGGDDITTPKQQSCVEETYSANSENTNLFNYAYKGKLTTNGSWIEHNGLTAFSKSDNPEEIYFYAFGGSYESRVIAFEEGKWALWYTCTENEGSVDAFALWSKTRTLNPEITSALVAVANGLGLNKIENFFPIFQNDCAQE